MRSVMEAPKIWRRWLLAWNIILYHPIHISSPFTFVLQTDIFLFEDKVVLTWLYSQPKKVVVYPHTSQTFKPTVFDR